MFVQTQDHFNSNLRIPYLDFSSLLPGALALHQMKELYLKHLRLRVSGSLPTAIPMSRPLYILFCSYIYSNLGLPN